MLTEEELKRQLSYNTETGVFTRLVSMRGIRAGTIAGSLSDQGYIIISINGVKYRAHRLAWLYITGSFPTKNIDHINGDRNDNKWRNLREASQSENMANIGKHVDNKSGFKGVSWHKPAKKWWARCRTGGKNHSLGLFDTPDEANEVYQAFAKEHHKEFYNSGVIYEC